MKYVIKEYSKEIKGANNVYEGCTFDSEEDTQVADHGVFDDEDEAVAKLLTDYKSAVNEFRHDWYNVTEFAVEECEDPEDDEEEYGMPIGINFSTPLLYSLVGSGGYEYSYETLGVFNDIRDASEKQSMFDKIGIDTQLKFVTDLSKL